VEGNQTRSDVSFCRERGIGGGAPTRRAPLPFRRPLRRSHRPHCHFCCSAIAILPAWSAKVQIAMLLSSLSVSQDR